MKDNILVKNAAIRTLEDMFLDNNITDVNIVSDDSIEFKAHKIVLSSRKFIFLQGVSENKY